MGTGQLKSRDFGWPSLFKEENNMIKINQIDAHLESDYLCIFTTGGFHEIDTEEIKDFKVMKTHFKFKAPINGALTEIRYYWRKLNGAKKECRLVPLVKELIRRANVRRLHRSQS